MSDKSGDSSIRTAISAHRIFGSLLVLWGVAIALWWMPHQPPFIDSDRVDSIATLNDAFSDPGDKARALRGAAVDAITLGLSYDKEEFLQVARYAVNRRYWYVGSYIAFLMVTITGLALLRQASNLPSLDNDGLTEPNERWLLNGLALGCLSTVGVGVAVTTSSWWHTTFGYQAESASVGLLRFHTRTSSFSHEVLATGIGIPGGTATTAFWAGRLVTVFAIASVVALVYVLVNLLKRRRTFNIVPYVLFPCAILSIQFVQSDTPDLLRINFGFSFYAFWLSCFSYVLAMACVYRAFTSRALRGNEATAQRLLDC